MHKRKDEEYGRYNGEKTPLNDLMRETMAKIREMVDTNTIVGQPITTLTA